MRDLSEILRPLTSGSRRASMLWIICPFAGASYGSFRQWGAVFPSGHAASLVTYPGRDQRVREAPSTRISTIAAELAHGLHKLTPQMWLMVGHSMGAQVAFETVRILEMSGKPPACLVLSACHAAHLEARRRLALLSDDAFVDELHRSGGCSEGFREDAELRAVYLPVIRKDFVAAEDYFRPRVAGARRLKTPTLLLYGTDDREALEPEVAAWREWLEGPTELDSMEGGHFYITQQPAAFVDRVRSFYEALTPVARE